MKVDDANIVEANSRPQIVFLRSVISTPLSKSARGRPSGTTRSFLPLRQRHVGSKIIYYDSYVLRDSVASPPQLPRSPLDTSREAAPTRPVKARYRNMGSAKGGSAEAAPQLAAIGRGPDPIPELPETRPRRVQKRRPAEKRSRLKEWARRRPTRALLKNDMESDVVVAAASRHRQSSAPPARHGNCRAVAHFDAPTGSPG